MDENCIVARSVEKDLHGRYLYQTHTNTSKIELIDPSVEII